MDLRSKVSCYASEVRERLSIYIQYASGQEANCFITLSELGTVIKWSHRF